jgi:lysophospholipase L1-like esterase
MAADGRQRRVVAGLLGGLVAGVGLLPAQARWARWRHGWTPPPDPVVDLVVEPATSRPGDLPGQRQRPYRLVALGDSGMSGVGADSFHDILAVQLARRLADATRAPVHVVSHARAGSRTGDVLAEQIPRVAGADAVVLMVGTNDVVYGTPVRALRKHTDEVLTALEGVPVVMSSLPDFRTMRAIAHPLRDVVAAYARVVDRIRRTEARRHDHVTFVDVGATAGTEFRRTRATMSADSFHPSNYGYRLIADSLLPGLLGLPRATSLGRV